MSMRGASKTGPTIWCACKNANCRMVGNKDIPKFEPDAKGLAGRDASAKVLNAIAQNVPWLIGGAADLAPSDEDAVDV